MKVNNVIWHVRNGLVYLSWIMPYLIMKYFMPLSKLFDSPGSKAAQSVGRAPVQAHREADVISRRPIPGGRADPAAAAIEAR